MIKYILGTKYSELISREIYIVNSSGDSASDHRGPTYEI